MLFQNLGHFQVVIIANDKGFHGLDNGEIDFVCIHYDKALKNIADAVNN
ncbi:hypothetical protein D1BOALGB6SA_10510 [Olavius sp. associated proteobacterium Delta 1]|nr:hypothetical protein D1BOALGB6SA_10510 [Olavius sp. associated proteobacterium Delta 1]